VTEVTFWSFLGDGKLLRQMSEDRRASQTDDQDLQRSCLAAIWFEFVDRHTQHRCYQGNDDSIKAENKQAAAPEVSDWKITCESSFPTTKLNAASLGVMISAVAPAASPSWPRSAAPHAC